MYPGKEPGEAFVSSILTALSISGAVNAEKIDPWTHHLVTMEMTTPLYFWSMTSVVAFPALS